MGIVRDVTVDQLRQAVNNIDTSTLAQDSTLQAVVTAINNISGGNDPVTNTTVNTLGKDTTLQSIAAAIIGLGTALGSDRALINGSNIADKGAFREAIGIQFTPSTTVTSTSLSGYSNYADLVIAEDGCYSFKTYTYATSPVNLILSFANGSAVELWGYVFINAPQYTTIHSPILWLKKGTYKLRATGDHVNMYKYS